MRVNRRFPYEELYGYGLHTFSRKKEPLVHLFLRRIQIVQLNFLYKSGEVLHRAFHRGVNHESSGGVYGEFWLSKNGHFRGADVASFLSNTGFRNFHDDIPAWKGSKKVIDNSSESSNYCLNKDCKAKFR